MSGQMPESERERQPGGSNANWPTAALLMFALLVLATCYLGRIEALPWQ